MASSRSIGQILGQRVAHYRERAGLKQHELAERLASLGFDMSRVTIANIEAAGREGATNKNRTRADNATLVDVLALAAALRVPPPLLFIPLGETEEMEFGSLTVHPDLMLRWVAGDVELTRLTDEPSELASISIGIGEWSRNAQPIQMFRQLNEIQDRASEATNLLRRLEEAAELGRGGVGTADKESREGVQRVLDKHLRDLDQHHKYMKAAGLSVPEIADQWAARMMALRDMPEDDR